MAIEMLLIQIMIQEDVEIMNRNAQFASLKQESHLYLQLFELFACFALKSAYLNGLVWWKISKIDILNVQICSVDQT